MIRTFAFLLNFSCIGIASAQSIECTFQPIANSTYEVDRWQAGDLSQVKPLKINFSEFDHKTHKARKESNSVTIDVFLIASKGRLSMLDAVPSGDMSLTSIKDMGDGRWTGVHSRHIAASELTPSQYIGECLTR